MWQRRWGCILSELRFHAACGRRPADPSVGYTHPIGADEVVISYAELGGFMPRELSSGSRRRS